MSTEPLAFDDIAQEREWQLQERALREERAGVDICDDDALVLRYRLLSRAIGEMPSDLLPAGFALGVARRAERNRAENSPVIEPLLASFERNLLFGLIVLFVAAVGFTLVLTGTIQQIGDATLRVGPMLVNGWLLTCLVCLAFTFVMPWPRWIQLTR